MIDLHVSIASVDQHADLNRLYVRWGYHGGITDTDIVYVAHVAGEPVGIVRRTTEFGVVMLRGMQVSRTHQRQGIGTGLLRALVADLPPSECFCIPFAHLTRFYAQGGFSLVEEVEAPAFLRERLARYRVEGHDVVVMRRPPAPGFRNTT